MPGHGGTVAVAHVGGDVVVRGEEAVQGADGATLPRSLREALYDVLTCTWSKWFAVAPPRSSMPDQALAASPAIQICCW